MTTHDKTNLFFCASKKLSIKISGFIEKNILRNKKKNHFKLVAIEKSNDETLHALIKIQGIQGIHNSLPITYLLQDLIKNELLLMEFSQTDVKALTFYAFYETFMLKHKVKPRYKISSQDFFGENTVYTIHDNLLNGYLRKSPQDLFNDNLLLAQFDLIDIKNIITTATQQETFLTLENLQRDSQYV